MLLFSLKRLLKGELLFLEPLMKEVCLRLLRISGHKAGLNGAQEIIWASETD